METTGTHIPFTLSVGPIGWLLFAAFAVVVGIAIRRLWRRERDERRRRVEAERSLRWKSASEALATALSVAMTPTDVATACAFEVTHAMEAATTAVASLGADGTSLDILHAIGYEESLGRIPLSAGSVLAEALRDRELVFGPPVDLEAPAPPNTIDSVLLRRHGFVVVPLVAAGRARGVVVLGFDGRRELEDIERDYLIQAGQRTGQSLERARAHESAVRARADGEAFRVRADAELQERRRAEQAYRESEARYRALAARTRRLYTLNAALSEAVSLDAVAKAVVRHGRSVVGAAAGAVALCADEHMFETLFAEEYPPPVVEAWHRFPAEAGLCTTAAVGLREPVLVGSFLEWQQQYPRSAASAADGGFTSTASLPLLVDNKPIGVLSFHFTVPINFDHDYRELLISVARHAAQAIDRARLYEATQRARVNAEAANRAKDDFLSIVSHELRTPLNAILGWGAMLREGSLDGAHVERATEAIVNNATRQARLVDELLEVSRIVAGRVSLDLQELDVATIVRGAVEAMLPTATQQGVELRIDRLPHARVVADPHRLEQVFGNLLANAVKFTSAGGRVTVDASIENETVRVRVVDTGCGIEPEVLPHIFERFRQGSDTTVRSTGGLGLGLFIVNRLVAALHGDVVAESAGAGKGATFVVSLPIRAVLSPDAAEATPKRPNGSVREVARPELAGVHVLVVDDEPDAREMMASALELSGATVIAAGSVPEAFATLTKPESRIRVLLADLAMPHEDGFALIRRIRMDPNRMIAQLPAAAVTACAGADERDRALAAGFHLHLAKPVSPADLVDVVARLAGPVTGAAVL